MKAKIFQPTKNAMQSGYRNTKFWLLEFEPSKDKRYIEPIMGWTGSSDMTQEVRLKFETKEEAIAYAEKQGLEYDIITPKTRTIKPKSYAENFKVNKPENVA